MQQFGLTLEQTRIMFSYQYHLVLADIAQETDPTKKIVKEKWLARWREATELFLKSQSKNDASVDSSFDLFTDFELLRKNNKYFLNSINNKLTIYLLLLEATLFKPYYPLGDGYDESFKNLKIFDEEKLNNQINNFAEILGVASAVIKRFKPDYNEAIQGIKGGVNPWFVGAIGAALLAVVAAFFTPVIATMLAPILAPGLYGAAAVSAVLATLGGGAIAAGGFGMAGGFVVVVAGGAVLGAGAGAGASALFSQSPNAALIQAAKLEVIMKVIVLILKDSYLAQEVIKEQRQAIRSLEDKLDELVFKKEKNQAEIENLKKSIEYLRNALKRNQELLQNN